MSTDSGSGNRWEPAPPPATDEDGAASEQPEQPGRAGRRDGLPTRPGWFAAGAAAVALVVGGAGGFMVGHATAADAQDRTPFGQQRPPNGFGPGGGQQGQMPGMPPRSNDRRGQGPRADGSGT